ncbi:hypothetical protein NDU88_001019 [Pleurodeles waltl]|uniref:Uncharacterized protein n=1 Tax=Pleurodeles waltl TaxID=8319 RepID=A0AAV7P9Y9_PLEWA|nr:hypothetical protein NDU88_001019 [Pleurodeles waltl]
MVPVGRVGSGRTGMLLVRGSPGSPWAPLLRAPHCPANPASVPGRSRALDRLHAASAEQSTTAARRQAARYESAWRPGNFERKPPARRWASQALRGG